MRLATTSGKSIAAVERELGLSDGTFKVWLRRASLAGQDAFPGHGRLKPQDAEVGCLGYRSLILFYFVMEFES